MPNNILHFPSESRNDVTGTSNETGRMAANDACDEGKRQIAKNTANALVENADDSLFIKETKDADHRWQELQDTWEGIVSSFRITTSF